jgi:outer membrane protein
VKRLGLVIGLAALAPALSAQPPAFEQILTLEESVDRALQNNQRLLLAKEDVRIAEQRVREAQSQYYPEVGLNLNSSRYLAEAGYVLPEDFGLVLLRPSRGLESDTFHSARVWMRQPLYNGGRTGHAVRLSRANLESAGIQHEAVRGQIVFDVTRTFHDVLLREKEIGLYEAAAAELEQASARAPGEARAEIAALQARLRRGLSEKRRLRDKARLEYRDALGVELYTNLGVKGELSPGRFNGDLAKLLAWAQESRAEIRHTGFQQEIDRLAVDLSMAERYPVVAFGAVYEMNDQEFPLDTTQWSATLNVSLPIFDGFSSRSRIRQRRARANQSRIQKAETEDRVNLEVREAYADAVHWTEERQRREKDLETRPAPAGALERARAAAWRLEAEEAYWQAVHGQRVALAKLEKAVGRPLE